MASAANDANVLRVQTVIEIAGFLVPILLGAIGFYVRAQRLHVAEVERRSYKRHEDAKELIREAERRSVDASKDAESRTIAAVKDAELRCEKSDARILEAVNSQYSELRKDIRDISRDISTLARSAQEA